MTPTRFDFGEHTVILLKREPFNSSRLNQPCVVVGDSAVEADGFQSFG
jgi:hypothetical protein